MHNKNLAKRENMRNREKQIFLQQSPHINANRDTSLAYPGDDGEKYKKDISLLLVIHYQLK